MKKIIISSICAFLGAICIIGLLILLWNIKIGQRGDEFGRVMSIEEICTRINYARRNIHKRCLDYNYKKQCTDFYNIDLTRNNIANRTTSSWYEEQYTNNKESLITITFSVEGNILWFEIEEKDYLDAEIVFENVSFIYPNQEKKSLSNINLTIKKGERISIVGENGAGKTTFIKLLLRLYEPTEGRILFNGIDIRDIDYQDYQKIFSTVFQDYKLFAFRIIDNITSLEGNEAEKEKVMKCLEKAGLSSKIEKLEHGLDTYLYNIYDEEGIELSGGESQKLAIARALYKDSPIVILDEPTAALDPRAEYEIYTRFLALVESKTSIFISHRLSSTKLCDRIVLFKDGSIEETGTHNELLQKGGLYAELFRMQAQFYFDN